jgi:predicted P-loop ATPase
MIHQNNTKSTDNFQKNSNRLIKFSVADNFRDRYPKNKELPFQEFVKLFNHTHNLKDCQDLGLSTRTRSMKGGAKEDPNRDFERDWATGFYAGWFDGAGREEQNMLFRTAIVLDADSFNGNYMEFQEALQQDLNKYEYILYTTSSHTFEKPKVRIILFTNQEYINKTDYRRIAENFINSLTNIKHSIDEASKTPNHMMLFPFIHRKNPEYIYDFYYNEGKLIDANSLCSDKCLPSPAGTQPSQSTKSGKGARKHTLQQIEKIRKSKLKTEDIIAFLERTPSTDLKRNEWLDIGIALFHRYEAASDGLEIFIRWSEKDEKAAEKGRYEKRTIAEVCIEAWDSFSTEREDIKTFESLIKDYKRINREKRVEKLGVKDDICNDPLSSLVWIDTEKDKPYYTENNLKVILREYKVEVGFDVITKQISATINGEKYDNLNSFFTKVENLCLLNKIKHTQVRDTLISFAHKNKVNTLKAWVTGVKWDNQDRLQDFLQTIAVKREYEGLKNVYITKWLIQFVHMTCLNSGVNAKQARQVLVFQGEQRIGKTTWFTYLIPGEHRENWLQEGQSIDTNNRMDVYKVAQKALVELGELAATFRKSDKEQFKNYITSTSDLLDLKYQGEPVKHRRTTTFFASVNDASFLNDETGSSRFLVLPVLSCNAFHNIDMQQLYAQILEQHKETNYNLSKEEIIMQQRINEEFSDIDPLEQEFGNRYEYERQEREKRVRTARSILEEMGYNKDDLRLARHLTKIIRNKKYGCEYVESNGQRGWRIPPLRTFKPIY